MAEIDKCATRAQNHKASIYGSAPSPSPCRDDSIYNCAETGGTHTHIHKHTHTRADIHSVGLAAVRWAIVIFTGKLRASRYRTRAGGVFNNDVRRGGCGPCSLQAFPNFSDETCLFISWSSDFLLGNLRTSRLV